MQVKVKRSPPASAVKACALVLGALWLLVPYVRPAGGLEPAAPFAGPLQPQEIDAVVTRAGALLAAQYVDPRRGHDAQEKITDALAAGAYDGIADPGALAQRLTGDLVALLHDKHIFVTAEPAPTPPDADQTGMRPAPASGGFARVDRLKGNIGYIRLLSFPMPAIFTPAADRAMRDVAGTDALIIDIRDNGGGSLESESYFVSFFFDPGKPVALNSVVERVPWTSNRFTTVRFWTRPVATPYLNKPIYILTGGQTYSAAEAFAYDLKARGRAAIYGETTGGAANPGSGRMLDPRFEISIPTGRVENPITGTSWEGVGVAPDVPVDEGRAFQAAARDILLKRNGLGDVESRLAVETGVDPFVEAQLLHIRTAPLPGSEATVLRTIDELVAGAPVYKLMSDELAGTIRLQLPRLQYELGRLGPIDSVAFQYVNSQGLDVFDVTMAKGSFRCGIFVGADGVTETMWFRLVPPGAPGRMASGGAQPMDRAQSVDEEQGGPGP